MAIYRNEVGNRDEADGFGVGKGTENQIAESLNLTVEIASALSDATRVRILVALINCKPCCESGTRELCACQIVYLIGLAQSTVSKHISILKQAGLVTSRKCGRWIYFRLAGDDAPKVVSDAIDWLNNNLTNDSQIVADKTRLAEIASMDVEDVCRVCLRS
jgi:ArsR family transcriptional regulator, arsenate/arsenite/antimonite-responsive transcriptional repressor